MPRRWREVSLANIGFGVLAALIRTTFVVRDAKGSAQTLVLVGAERASGGDGSTETFSLVFRGDTARALGQNTYAFDHSRLGHFEMFIVPVGRENQDGSYYEAVFNRTPPESQSRGRGVGSVQNR